MRISLIHILSALAALSVGAAAAAVEPGSEALPFIRFERGLAESSLAGAGIASFSNMAYASFGNPAAIPFSKKKLDIEGTWLRWMPETFPTDYYNFAGTYNSGNFGLTLGFSSGKAGEKVSGTSFTPSDLQVNGGGAYRVADFLSVGVNLRYASSKVLENYSYSAFGGDVFVTGQYKGLNVALGVRSIGASITDNSGASFSLPTSIAFGLAYAYDFAEVHSIEGDLDADWWLSGALSAAVGVQYGYNDMVFVRAGARYGGKSVIPDYASVGVGVKFYGVKVGLSYLFGSDLLKNSMTIGLGYCF